MRWPPARKRSTRSRNACRCGKKRYTRAAKNGLGAAHDRRSLQRGLMDLDPYQAHDYNPIRTGTYWRGRLRRMFGPIIAGAIALAKWTFILIKFGSIFIAVGGYALIFGWKFAVGLVLLILLHEMGHFIEAKREGLDPKLPIFIPFL